MHALAPHMSHSQPRHWPRAPVIRNFVRLPWFCLVAGALQRSTKTKPPTTKGTEDLAASRFRPWLPARGEWGMMR